MIIRAKINLSKIDKEKLFKGEKGIYLDLTLLTCKENDYGDDYMICQDLGQEARLAGKRGPIVGNGKIVKTKLDEDSDGLPF